MLEKFAPKAKKKRLNLRNVCGSPTWEPNINSSKSCFKQQKRNCRRISDNVRLERKVTIEFNKRT